jgi:predicted enzyme related to lactoylglutathione lyase
MFVPNLSFVLLFVENPLQSSSFYSQIFDQKPLEESPTFVLFALPNGIMLGLWSRKTAEPSVLAAGGGSEIAFSNEDVDEVHRKWSDLGIPMAQAPTDMDFGRTFVALDPDGHRIRVYRLHEEG